MRIAALILFFGYVGLLIVAGAWGIVGARLDLPLDGRPSDAMLGFLGWEAVGVVVIAWHTRTVRREQVA